MKQKLLLFLMMVSFGMLYAQDTIRTVVISEIRYDRADHAYIELSNMGDAAVNLSEFELIQLGPWDPFPDGRLWPTEPHRVNNKWLMLPDHVLAPGESYVLATFHDWEEEQYADDVAKFGWSYDHPSHVTKPEFFELADLQVHRAESPTNDPSDSISENVGPLMQNYRQVLECWQGRETLFLRHHPPGADSCVVDQVGGEFSDPDGTNENSGYRDVAGMSQATNNASLVRRFDVKQGNLTWIPGKDLAESEWIPIPHVNQWGGGYETGRALYWTIGNHGDYNLDETHLTSSTIDIDWTGKILTVPWGVRNDDSIMYQFDRKPGIAWHYIYSPVIEDSSFVSCRTGDSLVIFVCGNDLDVDTFRIEVAAPTADANIVMPKRGLNDDGDYVQSGAPFEVSHNMGPNMDTISEIPFATRVDTLQKYLEKAPNASWEIIWVDATERTDLKEGDILRVTAEDGTSVKDYYLKLQLYRESRNAYLAFITWPDIPEDYKGIFGWDGDTIPSFLNTKYEYKVQVPWDVDGVPALLGKTEDQNATLEVQRAANLFGSAMDRTATFTVTAENDTSVETYTVLMEKEKAGTDIQPWEGDPFVSQFVFWEEYTNGMVEIVNPGNKPLDLSNYMFFNAYQNDPAAAIADVDWGTRYKKYIPGYKWTSLQSEWDVDPGFAVQDLNINPIIQPGDVFVMADIRNSVDDHWYRDQFDIDFNMDTLNGFKDLWGESYQGESAARQWKGANFYLWKIMNDSIKLGLKAANDPNDFELIEVFGSGDGSDYAPLGVSAPMISSFTRKPGVYKGVPEFNGSFDTIPENSEWIEVNQDILQALGRPWPDWRYAVPDGLGSHFMDDVTVYRSTVSSTFYLVSSGYSMDEEIRGVVTATTVDDMIGNLIPADVNQSLTVVSSADGSVLTGTAAVSNGDTLVVLSADSINTSKYILEVSDQGLSDDALLTSDTYTITVDGETGTVGGMEYGTTLKAVVDGVTVPAGASMEIIDADGAYQPLVMLNFDTVYVDVTVNAETYFEVIAEDGATKITYQITPNATASDAFVTSDVFMVDQTSSLISLIPEGTNVGAFLSNLVPAPGASMKLIDKFNFERTDGLVVLDDKLVVTSEDESTVRTYYLSVLDQVANYLAYVVSEVYLVDQEMLTISGVRGSHSVTDFLANVSPAPEAMLEVQDAGGTAKTDADMMAEADILQVTAGNGINIVEYTVSLDYTGLGDLSGADISIYPNPTNGQLTIAGAEAGSRIRVYNAVGTALHDVIVYSGIERISLDDQPGGMYFITISNDDDVVGHYKVIKQ